MKKEYYYLPLNEVKSEFSVEGTMGLKSEDAIQRQNRYGVNRLNDEKKNSAFNIFIHQFLDPIIILLLSASLISIFLGDIVDALIIFLIVFLSAVLSFWQEFNADKAMDDLASMIKSKVTVLRDGVTQEIDAQNVVPGDLVVLSAGDIIPADGRFIDTNNLTVNESSLTGESFSVEKNTEDVSQDTPLAKRSNSGFMGTNIVSGKGTLLITNIGKDTYFGSIANELSKNAPTTEFKKGLNRFGRMLMVISAIMITVIFIVNIMMKKEIYDSFMFAISLAVGITPQLLPAISSINLSLGAKRMAKKDVIIRQLEVIDNIGGMDVLCSDKTGTITQGSVNIDGVYDISGNKSKELLRLAADNSFYSSINNNSIDTALKSLKSDEDSAELITEKPYNFNDKISSVALNYNGHVFLNTDKLIIMKGAVSNVLSSCDRALLPDGSTVSLESKRENIETMARELSMKGFRCLGLAVKDYKESQTFNQSMIFAGFITLFDPLKEDSLDVIKKINNLNVDFKIITGDSLLVARFLAGELDIDVNDVISSIEFQKLSKEEKLKKVESIKIFAEVEPEMKKNIIILLKENNHLVGYMGDGINDVPSLHEADVAISVDDATDVAKDAANIVLLKSDLNVVVDAIKEGRKVFANTMKYIFIAISANFGNMFSMAGASLLLKFLPLLPKQILITNLLQDLPSMTLASDNVDDSWISEPHRFNFDFIVKFMITFGIVSSVFDYSMFAILLLKVKASESLFQTAWFTESVISAILLMLILRTSRSTLKSKPSNRLLVSSIVVIIFTACLSYLPFSKYLGFTPLPLSVWIYIGVVVLLYMIVGEFIKRIFYKYNRI